jgi:5-methylcytosine-specific restriction endonuclease McrA
LSKVFVLDTKKRPLDPVHPGWARKLLSSGRAAVWRRYPFTLILKKEINQPEIQPLRLKIDPGSKVTGIAVVNDSSGEVVFAAELQHRGQAIKAALDGRRAARRSRRQRKTRYRKPRFENRVRSKGLLAPSLMSRISNIETWTCRIMRFCPIASISQELVKFDMQEMDNPEIEGAQYQHGTLAGYEVREYLLLKWGHTCAYCLAQDVPLQVEHIVSRARGGSNRVSNLCLACGACNNKKGTQDIRDFLKQEPELLERILTQAKASLRDAASVNSTRWALLERLKVFGVPIERGSGGLTKYNRATRGLEKTHWLDAACVGRSTPEILLIKAVSPLHIKAVGTGSRQMCRMDRYGFPRTGPKQAKRVKGFQTGDLVLAIVPSGKHTGTYVGRVAVRAMGAFNITTTQGTVQGISHRHCKVLHRCDGYSYEYERRSVFALAS